MEALQQETDTLRRMSPEQKLTDTVDSDSLLEWAQRLDLVRTLERAREFSPD